MRHSRTPWTAKYIPSHMLDRGCFAIQSPNGVDVATVHSSPFAATNAALIARAPQLYRAAKQSLPWIAKVAADQPEGDPTGLAAKAMRHYAFVERTITLLDGSNAPDDGLAMATPLIEEVS